MSLKFKHPMTCMVAGPTGCGKTMFVRKLLKHKHDMFDPPPQRIIWCYGVYQSGYADIMKENPNIEFVEGLPHNFETTINPKVHNLVVVDDLMDECGHDSKMSNLFTRGSHHRNLSVIFIVQNMYFKGKESRNISLNTQYLVFFKSPRDKSQITHLGRQLYPGNSKFVQEAYNDATLKPYGYLLVDLKPDTPEEYRLRTCVFPDELTIVYVKK